MSAQPPSSPPRFLTPARLAEVMDVSDSTVEEWIRKKRLPSFKAGRVRRFAVEDVLEFVRSYTVRAKVKSPKSKVQGPNGIADGRWPIADDGVTWERIERLVRTEIDRVEQRRREGAKSERFLNGGRPLSNQTHPAPSGQAL